ncbi:MAG TPA: PQQ-binding-like beta-propeller repeat protein [Ktedonobacteraceae bacterium]|jgi:outer membrane protein assembly factor BamB|nr:PQQ-binding-like beta-propeller repeat protein [Ktedonobacteraceae bacterium]
MASTALKKLQTWSLGQAIWAVALSNRGHIAAAAGPSVTYGIARETSTRKVADDEIWSIALSADGQLIATGSNDHYVVLYSARGDKLWEFKTGEHVLGTAISTNGFGLAVTSRDRTCRLFSILSNIPLWSYKGPDVFLRVAISANGRRVAAGTYGGEVYLFNEWGEVLWHDRGKRSGDIWGLAFSESDEYLVVGSEKDGRLDLYQLDGKCRWSKWVGASLRGIAITSDGQYIAALTQKGTLLFYRHTGEKVWQYSLGGECCSLAMNSDGSYFIVGCYDGQAHLLENPGQHAVSAHPTTDQSALWIVPRVMHAIYHSHPDRGLCAWFDIFDYALRRLQLDFCQALLTEINEHRYPFLSQEQRGVDSRAGAYLLARGLAHHKQGRLQQAREYYQESLSYYQKADDITGQGQAHLLLDTQEPLQHDYASLWIGSGEQYFMQRLKTISASDIPRRLAMMEAAREHGWYQALRTAVLDAQDDDDMLLRQEVAVVRHVAIAAFERRTALVDMQLLQGALADESWVVRWRAANLAQSVYALWSSEEQIKIENALRNALHTETYSVVKAKLESILREIHATRRY